MRILVTGGAGYIGSALCPYLRDRGHHVVACDVAEYAPVERWRIRYQQLTESSLMGFDTIIHLAAHSSVRACEEDRVGAAENNLTGVIELAGKLRGPRLILASTGSIYDTSGIRAVYDETKRAADQIVPMLYPNTRIVRFGTVCGVSPVMREDLLLNGMTRDAVRKGEVWVSNGNNWRPVLFLSDLCARMGEMVGQDDVPPIQRWASVCWPIRDYAEAVSVADGVRIMASAGFPTYDFRMPVGERKWSVGFEVAALLTYWREESRHEAAA